MINSNEFIKLNIRERTWNYYEQEFININHITSFNVDNCTINILGKIFFVMKDDFERLVHRLNGGVEK